MKTTACIKVVRVRKWDTCSLNQINTKLVSAPRAIHWRTRAQTISHVLFRLSTWRVGRQINFRLFPQRSFFSFISYFSFFVIFVITSCFVAIIIIFYRCPDNNISNNIICFYLFIYFLLFLAHFILFRFVPFPSLKFWNVQSESVTLARV